MAASVQLHAVSSHFCHVGITDHVSINGALCARRAQNSTHGARTSQSDVIRGIS